MKNDMIYLARLTVEAASPLGIGSGRRGVVTDRLVARDAYGLPYLPGTALAGCLRSSLTEATNDERIIDNLFGTQEGTGWGSRVILSSGHLVGSNGKVAGESAGMPDNSDPYLTELTEGALPERDHVRINSRGVADAKGHGKFDEQLVPKGVRFLFDLLLTGNAEDSEEWTSLVQQFSQPYFRIGGGTRKGFGKLRVKEIEEIRFDLRTSDHLEAYLSYTGALDEPLPSALSTSIAPATAQKNAAWQTYTLKLKARDYFQFGKGVGGTADNKNTKDGWVNKKVKRETTVVWKGNKPTVVTDRNAHYLIPATSIKGALSHRTAYHYNKLSNVYVEDQQVPIPKPDYDAILEELIGGQDVDLTSVAAIQEEIARLTTLRSKKIDEHDFSKNSAINTYKNHLEEAMSDEGKDNIGEKNNAVCALFGFAVEGEEAERGKVLIDDVFLPASSVKSKTFSHVMIDRFTGGAKAWALFNEEVASADEEIEVLIHVHKSAFEGDDNIQAAFEEALLDVANGQLPLGGGVAKGHGIFIGELEKQ